MLSESGEFVINLPDEKLVKALDYCGVRSIATVDKWKEMNLHEEESAHVSAPSIKEAPVSIECRVTQVLPLGSHDMFLAEVVAVRVDEKFIDEKGAFHMDQVGLVAYSHGDYMSLGEKLGSFGYSVRKKPLPAKRKPAKKEAVTKASASEKPSGSNHSTKKKPSVKKPSVKKHS
jgi:hypothetical protein